LPACNALDDELVDAFAVAVARPSELACFVFVAGSSAVVLDCFLLELVVELAAVRPSAVIDAVDAIAKNLVLGCS